jgi:Predicted membrane protein
VTDDTGPTPPSERIVSLDVLRGVAVLGILVINVRVYSMPEVTLTNPNAYGDFTGPNYLSWLAGHVLAELKFITLFSALFGAGIVLFTERKEEPIALHHRRTAWLLAIGLGHAYLLWYGDILVPYALCAFVLVGFRRRPPSVLAKAGLLLVLVPSVLEVFAGATMGAEAVAGQWMPAESTLQEEVRIYRGGLLEQLEHRVPTSLRRQTLGFLGGTFWRVGGTMLLGMALYRWGVLTDERSNRLYALLAAGGLAGVGVVLAGVWFIEAANWEPGVALFWRQFNYWGSFLVAGGYIGVVTLYTRWRPRGLLTRALAAVGRTAFTNYLLQTVVATTLFYGHGFGLFGSVSRAEALGFVAVFWVVQITLSVLWLRLFRFGPVEWLWRTLTYEERQPLRREPTAED